jgi:quercetin dioxygenase-like cupin family protein
MSDDADTTIIKVDSSRSPRGAQGQRYLAAGVSLSMRLWEREPPGESTDVTRDYETIGYVIAGRAELHLSGQLAVLEPGNCWVVPRGAPHRYRVLEEFTAVEATHPPAELKNRDAPP